MSTVRTVRISPQWLRRAAHDCGGVGPLAERIGVDRSTLYRHLAGDIEAGPRIIAAVLAAFPVRFEAAFETVEVPSARRRYSYRPAA